MQSVGTFNIKTRLFSLKTYRSEITKTANTYYKYGQFELWSSHLDPSQRSREIEDWPGIIIIISWRYSRAHNNTPNRLALRQIAGQPMKIAASKSL